MCLGYLLVTRWPAWVCDSALFCVGLRRPGGGAGALVDIGNMAHVRGLQHHRCSAETLLLHLLVLLLSVSLPHPRSLKPENFLVTDRTGDARIKLSDFGLSTFFREGQADFADVLGSAYYMAPGEGGRRQRGGGTLGVNFEPIP